MEITTPDTDHDNTPSLPLRHEAVLLLGEQMAQDGTQFPSFIAIRDVWYVFTWVDEYTVVNSQGEAEKRVSDLKAAAASQN